MSRNETRLVGARKHMSKRESPQQRTQQAVKERSAPSPSGLGRLFQNVQNALVPVSYQPQHSDQRDGRHDDTNSSSSITSTEKSLGHGSVPVFEETKLGQVTVVSSKTRDSQRRAPIADQQTSVTSTQLRKTQVKKRESHSSAGWLLLVPVVGLVTFALMEGSPLSSSSTVAAPTQKPTADDAAFRERVEFHRKMTGWKLNRERVDVDIQNRVTAPAIPFGVPKVAQPNIMKGLPLAGETHHRKSSRDRSEPLNPGYADARVMYGLQEEQDAREWEKRANELYVKEFIDNARRGGYDVRIEEDGSVTAKPIPRAPGSEVQHLNGAQYDSTDGSAY